jgi:hypothetical protein
MQNCLETIPSNGEKAMAKVNLVNLDRAMEQLEALKRAGVTKVVIGLISKKSNKCIFLGVREGFEIDMIQQLPSLDIFLVQRAGVRGYSASTAFSWSDEIEIQFEEY